MIKLIYDKKDNNSLYGQVTISILLVQDIIAILALVVLSGFTEGAFGFDYMQFMSILFKGLGLTIFTILFAKRFLGYVYNKIATSHELLILFTLGWAFTIALAAETIGLNIEVGAFIAGISLASLPYTYEINAKAKVLRDFFITLFFVALGAGMVFASMGPFIFPFIILSLFVLIGNPLIVMILMGLLGYDKRTSFFTGLSIANISEFSLIIIAMGGSLGHLNQDIVAMVTVIGILTMTISSYMMTYNNKIYNKIHKFLKIFEFKNTKNKLSSKKIGMQNHIILIGCGRMGKQILEEIEKFKDEFLVIDHDNMVIKNLIKKGTNCVFGDIEDSELLQELDIPDAEMIISTLPNTEDNMFLIKQLSLIPENKRPIIIVTSESGREGMRLFNKGADYVILKHYLGASHVHNINKQLYGLDDSESFNLSEIMADSDQEFSNDHDYAKLLHNLNKLRLAEIKRKIGKKSIILKSKKR